MKRKNANIILKDVLGKINPESELYGSEKILKDFLGNIKDRIKEYGVKAEVFIGGSYAKKTMIKKDDYDIDIFLRFDRKHKEISDLTEKILHGIKKRKIHGSRDYFEIKAKNNILFEIIPVLKIKNPKEAENVTDFSYSHVNYIKKKIKNDKILDEIKIAKAFCHANGFYGAESYIKGFSGYALELLIYHYGGFISFLREMRKAKDKTIIDIERQFKNKQEIMMNVNEAKLKSPVILIDPTYKNRNVLAALSYETFLDFQKTSREFLKNPSIKFFEKKKIDIGKIKDSAKKKVLDFSEIQIKTDKQEGDIAGTKLLKFYRHLESEIEKYFYVKNSGFEYDGGKTGRFFLVAKNKGEIILNGPRTNDEKNVLAFKKRHKNIFIKSSRYYARKKVDFNLREFLKNWENKNRKKIKEMDVSEFKII